MYCRPCSGDPTRSRSQAFFRAALTHFSWQWGTPHSVCASTEISALPAFLTKGDDDGDVVVVAVAVVVEVGHVAALLLLLDAVSYFSLLYFPKCTLLSKMRRCHVAIHRARV